MNYKKITPQKLRARLVRKGFFTQLPYPEGLNKELEGQVKLFRTLLDYTLFDATAREHAVRKDAIKQINPDSSCANDFNAMCSNAVLEASRTRLMMLNMLENFFPEVLVESSCSLRL